MKVVSIVGARPQFIKAAVVSCELRKQHEELLVHTGQHYDDNMSRLFFDEMGIPQPDVNLGVRSDSHGAQTAAMLIGIEEFLIIHKPDWVLVYGDTNSTLAGALAAAKLHIPVAHIEAGLRSFNRNMPEEINRLIADQLSTLLLCPSHTAVNNLAADGIVRGVHLVGDVMMDALIYAMDRARTQSHIIERCGLVSGRFILATIHRAENVDSLAHLSRIVNALTMIEEDVIFPVHPRTRKALEKLPEFQPHGSKLRCIEPVGYLDMVQLERSARMILTDSGGVQKEAYWLGVPCVTLREETEWVETVIAGWNKLVGTDTIRIVETVKSFVLPTEHPSLYGNGYATERCVALLMSL